MTIALDGGGHDVVTADNGVSALAIARTTVFDLVITDLQMPQMDGISLIGELRKLPGFRYKPMLMLTTDSSDESKQAGKLAGATGWIVKPVSAQQLRQMVSRVLAAETASGV